MPAGKMPNGIAWSEAEERYLQNNIKKLPRKQIAAALRRSESSVRNKALRMGLISRQPNRKNWSVKEDNVLYDFYPTHGAVYVAKRLKRTVKSVKGRARKLGVRFNDTGDISAAYIARAFRYDKNVIVKWITMYGLPARITKIGKSRFYNTTIEDFWSWAETHKDKVPFRNYIYGMMLPEPKWVEQAMEDDRKSTAANHRKGLTLSEIKKIKQKHEAGSSVQRLAREFGRTENAIKHITRMVI